MLSPSFILIGSLRGQNGFSFWECIVTSLLTLIFRLDGGRIMVAKHFTTSPHLLYNYDYCIGKKKEGAESKSCDFLPFPVACHPTMIA